MTRTITAFFDSRSDATGAVERLAAAGIPRDAIRLLPESDTVTSSTTDSRSTYDVEKDEKGFWESLGDLFFPSEDRYTYAEAMNRGNIMVTATVDDSLADQAEDILEEDGTINIDEHESAWRNEGWAGWQGQSESSSTTTSASRAGFSRTSDSQSGDREGIIPIAEEEMRVGKRDVNRGRVKVRSYVVETPVSEDVTLREESVNVERRPTDRSLGRGEADDLFQERTIEIEERGEEAVVEKTARVREEVAVGKTVKQRTETVQDNVRHTEVEVDDDRSSGTGSSKNREGRRTG